MERQKDLFKDPVCSSSALPGGKGITGGDAQGFFHKGKRHTCHGERDAVTVASLIQTAVAFIKKFKGAVHDGGIPVMVEFRQKILQKSVVVECPQMTVAAAGAEDLFQFQSQS